MEKPELIEICVFDSRKVQQYSFLIECVMDSIEFREVVDETLAKGYDGWSLTASLLSDDVPDFGFDDKFLGC